MAKQYDIAAYIWPSYTGKEPRSHIFWPEKYGEWQTVKAAGPKFEGHQWPRKPLWGYVDEADPCVMQMQIDAAADHGVNVFLYDWYWYDRRPFLEQCLNDGFLKAKNNDRMKFYLMWANHDANDTWDKRLAGDGTVIWDGKVNRAEFERACDRVIDQYFLLPNYYKIDGKPVFMIYDLSNLINGLGGLGNARHALDWFRERAVKKGLPGLHLQATLWGENSLNVSGVDSVRNFSQKHAVEALGFDSGSHYQYVHFTNVRRSYAELMPDVANEWTRVEKEYSIPYFPHVSLGWDNNPRFRHLLPDVMTGNTPEEIKEAFKQAKAFVDTHPNQPPLITVNSWNEWTESSYLQPDDLYGYGYLQAVRDVFMG
ncbi:MAG: glycoside hydrolase family 99-like domain-containing protein [Oscillospiraceae bacterium]